MREILRLIIPGVPVAQPRQRHAVIGGHARNYTPRTHPVQVYKAAVRLNVAHAMLAKGLAPVAGPVILEARFYLPRPKYLCRRKDPDGPILHGGAPDYDNLVKALQDALKGVAWRDDGQVAGYTGTPRKWYTEKLGAPRTELAIFVPIPSPVGDTGA